MDLVGSLIDASSFDWSKAPVSQASTAERQFLHAFVRDEYRGVGDIVELGVGGGGTAYAICMGLEENSKVKKKTGLVKLFDWYSMAPGHYASKVFFRTDHEKSQGNSFEDDVRRNLSEFRGLFEIYNGDIADVEIDVEDIEILHIDIAKTLGTFRAVMERFFVRAIPGKAAILHQDFASPSLSWIHYSTALLLPYIEILSDPIRSTLPFRLVQKVPDQLLNELIEDKISPDDKVKLIQSLKGVIKADRSGTLPYDAVFDMSSAFVWHRAGDMGKTQEWLAKCETVPYIADRRANHVAQLKKAPA